MILETFVLGMLENNNYLLIDDVSKDAILIDCTEYTDDIEEVLKKYNANLKYVLITHGHFDHILGLDDLHEKFPETQILAPIGDKDLIENVSDFVRQFVGFLDEVKSPFVSKYIDENEEIFIGDKKVQIILTSGHTKGGVCYFIDNKLFSGDTIFLRSVGRTDLPNGSYEQIRKSVKHVLSLFDDEVKIYCGHGDFTTVGYEKKYNPAL